MKKQLLSSEEAFKELNESYHTQDEDPTITLEYKDLEAWDNIEGHYYKTQYDYELDIYTIDDEFLRMLLLENPKYQKMLKEPCSDQEDPCYENAFEEFFDNTICEPEEYEKLVDELLDKHYEAFLDYFREDAEEAYYEKEREDREAYRRWGSAAFED